MHQPTICYSDLMKWIANICMCCLILTTRYLPLQVVCSLWIYKHCACYDVINYFFKSVFEVTSEIIKPIQIFWPFRGALQPVNLTLTYYRFVVSSWYYNRYGATSSVIWRYVCNSSFGFNWSWTAPEEKHHYIPLLVPLLSSVLALSRLYIWRQMPAFAGHKTKTLS